MPGSVTDQTLFACGLGTLRGVLRGAPLVVAPDLPIRQMLLAVEARAAEALVVVDPPSGIPLGVLSLAEILRRVAIEGANLDAPAASIMTAGMTLIDIDAPLQRAATLMVRRRLRHLVVVNGDGTLAGLLAQGDLYAPERGQTDEVLAAIMAAADIDALAQAARQIPVLAGRLIANGTGPETLCYWLSTLNDLVAMQVIDLHEAKFDLPVVPWCWMLFGSEGRFEQTLVSDQDNGLIFEATSKDEAEALRAAFLPFAMAVNAGLERCGYPLCRGGIMASNPRWCLSLDEWNAAFRGWLDEPQPEALLKATIFFDFRALYGNDALVARLKEYMLEKAGKSKLCLMLMARSALEVEPPLRWWQGFVYNDRKHPRSIDIKMSGARIFVDVARVMALLGGVGATGTIARLRAAGTAMHMAAPEISAMVDAFHVIQKLRLERQLSGMLADGHSPLAEDANRVAPDSLNKIERHLLRQAFGQARMLQAWLRMHLQIA